MAERASRAYVAGATLDDALRICGRAEAEGCRTTICAWNAGDDAPEENAARFLAAIDAAAARKRDCYVSLKAQDLRFSPDLTRTLFDRARRRDRLLHFDSMGPEDADRVFRLIESLLEMGPDRGGRLGCTLPGRWRRSLRDAERAVSLDLRPRVVKGQWPDPASPGLDPRAGFIEIIRRLAGRAEEVAVATHDPALAREALAELRAAGTCAELELLYGLPLRRILPVAWEAGVPVRLYVPYGRAWLPYAIGQIRKRPRIALRLLRDLLPFGDSGGIGGRKAG